MRDEACEISPKPGAFSCTGSDVLMAEFSGASGYQEVGLSLLTFKSISNADGNVAQDRNINSPRSPGQRRDHFSPCHLDYSAALTARLQMHDCPFSKETKQGSRRRGQRKSELREASSPPLPHLYIHFPIAEVFLNKNLMLLEFPLWLSRLRIQLVSMSMWV